jgi:dipeptidyl aminopeptidase/acylaminoacyl peptidase
MKHNPFLSFLLAILLALLSWGLPAQDCPPARYQRMMREANTAVQNGQYDLAINKLQSAKTCQPDSEAVVNLRVLEVFKEVNRQRELAIKNEREAKKQTKIAQTEREKAEAEARRIYANDLAFKSQIALREGDRTTAFRLAEMAGRYVEEGNPNVMQALVESLYYNDHLDTMHRLPWNSSLDANTSSVLSIAFSPEKGKLAAGYDDGIVRIWDLNTGQETATLVGHFSSIMSVSFSPDGSKLGTGSWDKTAKIWDLSTKKDITTFIGHTSHVWSIAFSPDGKKISTGSADFTSKIWDINSGKEEFSLIGHKSSVVSVAFSPDGQNLATGSWDNTAKVWNVENGREIATLMGHTSSIGSGSQVLI